MKNILTPIFTLVLMTWGCKSPSTNEKQQAPRVAADTSIEHVFNYMKGAAIPDTVKIKKAYFFSDSLAADTFELKVLPGLVSKTQSVFSIKSAGGCELYFDTFKASFLVRDIFEPDTTPVNGGQEVYDKYMHDFINSITREQIEERMKRNIENFFGDHITFSSEPDSNSDYEIIDSNLYSEVTKQGTKIIYLPCFECDEGGYFLGYSKDKKRSAVLQQGIDLIGLTPESNVVKQYFKSWAQRKQDNRKQGQHRNP